MENYCDYCHFKDECDYYEPHANCAYDGNDKTKSEDKKDEE